MKLSQVAMLLSVATLAASAQATVLTVGPDSTNYSFNANAGQGSILSDVFFNGGIAYYPTGTGMPAPHGSPDAHIGVSVVGYNAPNQETTLIFKFKAAEGYKIQSADVNFNYFVWSGWSTNPVMPGMVFDHDKNPETPDVPAYGGEFDQIENSRSLIRANYWTYDPGFLFEDGTRNGDYGIWNYVGGAPGFDTTALVNAVTTTDAEGNLIDSRTPGGPMTVNSTGIAVGSDTFMLIFTIKNSGFAWVGFENKTGLFYATDIKDDDGNVISTIPGLNINFTFAEIPEPATLSLAGLGAAAMMLRRSRK